MKELKEGAKISLRSFNHYNNTYDWDFKVIKKITPKGKIRLETGELLDTLGDYKIHEGKQEQLYNQDELRKYLNYMIFYIESNRNRILNHLNIEEILELGNLLEKFEIEDMERWSRDAAKERYVDCLTTFKKYRDILTDTK